MWYVHQSVFSTALPNCWPFYTHWFTYLTINLVSLVLLIPIALLFGLQSLWSSASFFSRTRRTEPHRDTLDLLGCVLEAFGCRCFSDFWQTWAVPPKHGPVHLCNRLPNRVYKHLWFWAGVDRLRSILNLIHVEGCLDDVHDCWPMVQMLDHQDRSTLNVVPRCRCTT